jgi:hypothetical protein
LQNPELAEWSPAFTPWDIGAEFRARHEFNVANDYDQFSGVVAGSGKLHPWQGTRFYFFSRNCGVKGANAVSPGSPGSPSTQRDI